MSEKQAAMVIIYNHDILLETRTIYMHSSKHPFKCKSDRSHVNFTMYLNKVDGQKQEKVPPRKFIFLLPSQTIH